MKGEESKKTTPNSSTVGLDVGAAGRWVRLAYGLFLLVPLIIQPIQSLNDSGEFLIFSASTILYFLAITIVYVAVYFLLGNEFLRSGSDNQQMFWTFHPG